MKKLTACFLFALAGLAWGAAEPTFELVASSTNLIVTEEVQVSLVLRLSPMPGLNAERQLFHPRGLPHITCSFLDPEWREADKNFERKFVKSAKIVREEKIVGNRRYFSSRSQACPCPILFASEQMRWPEEREPAFTLNDEMTYGVLDVAIMSLLQMQRPAYGRNLDRERLSLPFKAKREKDGSWLLTVSVAPWRAVKPGRLQLAAATVELPLVSGWQRERDDRNRRIPLFTNLVLRTQPLTLTVDSEPPLKGRPASWCGAISSSLNVTATLDAKVCTSGDPLTLTLEVAGAANPSSIRPPDFTSALAGSIFRIDTASLKTETLGTSRRFTWRVRSTKAGTVEFPALPVSYYDLDRRAYVTHMTESIPIQVKAGKQVVLTEEDGEEFPSPDGIDLDPRGAEAHPLLPHVILSVLLFLVSPALFLCIRFAPPVRRRIAACNAAYRKARAFSVCRRALKSRNAERRAAAIRRFFTVRYGVNGAAVTAADAQRLMAPDYSEEDVALIVMNLQTRDAQTYSTKPGAGSLALLLAAGLFLGAGAAQEAVDPARAEFHYKRACVLAVQAVDEAGFKRAADAYRDCLDAGANNATVYQNMGACLFLAGDARGSRVAFECAERRGGETPSTARGLKAVLAKQTNNPRAELSPTRVFLKPHVRWNVDVRLLCAAALWAFFWMVLLLPAGLPRRFLLLISVVAFCAAATSVGVSLVEEHQSAEVLHAQD